MSWSIHMNQVPADQVAQSIADAPIPAGLPPETLGEVTHQIAVAKAAALIIFTNDVVGTEGEYNVMLNGHAEPNHIRRPGYASDMVTVTIQRYYDYSVDGF